MTTNTKKVQMSVLTIFVAAALLGSIVAVTGLGDNAAYAGGDDNNKKKKKINDADQGIGQFSGTAQSSECGSGNDTEASCNNVALSFNLNDGNNALGQQ